MYINIAPKMFILGQNEKLYMFMVLTSKNRRFVFISKKKYNIYEIQTKLNKGVIHINRFYFFIKKHV